jgi:hypothetical protein
LAATSMMGLLVIAPKAVVKSCAQFGSFILLQ